MNKEKRGMFIPLSTERKIFLEDFLEQNCSFLIDKVFIEKLFNNFTQTEITSSNNSSKRKPCD